VYTVIVDAKTERVKIFYERLGFRPFPSQPLRLFMPLATVAKAAREG